MKVTVDLPDSLVLRLKLTAARRGKTVKLVATDTFRTALADTPSAPPRSRPRPQPPALRTRRRRVKLPLIIAPPDAPKFSLTGADIDRWLTEADLG